MSDEFTSYALDVSCVNMNCRNNSENALSIIDLNGEGYNYSGNMFVWEEKLKIN